MQKLKEHNKIQFDKLCKAMTGSKQVVYVDEMEEGILESHSNSPNISK